MIARIDTAALLSRWTGPSRVIRAAEMQTGICNRRPPINQAERLVKLLSTRRTVTELADITVSSDESVRYALRKLRRDGLVKPTGERALGKGAPEYWVAT
jgi:DNA-binding transcriptional ArsR family regulator